EQPTALIVCVNLLLQSSPLNGSFPEDLVISTTTKPLVNAIPFMRSIQFNPGSVYRITLSALASTFGGIVTPICFAAFRLMMNSNFFGCSIGKRGRKV